MTLPVSQQFNLEDSVNQNTYVVEPIFIRGHKIMLAAVEGGAKTWLITGTAVHAAAGQPMLGMPISHCPTLIIDEETPIATLESRLNRLSSGLGYKSYGELPIELRSKRGFRFGSKTSLTEIADPAIKAALKKFPGAQDLLITMDSHIAMIGATTHGNAENQDAAGKALGYTLEHILTYCRNEMSVTATIMLATHAKKEVTEYDIADMRTSEMQRVVRGHGSIVGLGCDTGFIVKKISENPLRGVLIPKPRRAAIPCEEIYWEMEEEGYGKGWARLVRINPIPIPPSDLAVQLYALFRNNPQNTYRALELNKQMAMHELSERKLALQQLQRHKIVFSTQDNPFIYQLNPDITKLDKFDGEYLEQLQRAYEKFFEKTT